MRTKSVDPQYRLEALSLGMKSLRTTLSSRFHPPDHPDGLVLQWASTDHHEGIVWVLPGKGSKPLQKVLHALSRGEAPDPEDLLLWWRGIRRNKEIGIDAIMNDMNLVWETPRSTI
ncbi:MAG: hypothetical protein RJR34_11350 [Candidatus Methanoculleus thermohydrogenotrophicum]|nr:hypothetical protein [Candidatus Methanoculleus thermohydrogenotrophicum]